MTILLTSLFLFIFGAFNLLGIKQALLPNHISYFLLGLAAFFLCKKIGMQFFNINAKFFYWLFILLLVLTFIIGLEAKGSRRWIDLYFFNFQASEFFKVFFILFLANLFSKNRYLLNNFSFLMISVFYFLLPAAIIFKQPDLGSMMVYVFIFFTMLLFSGIPIKHILTFSLIIALVIPLGWFTLKDYQKARIISFANPHVDQQGTSYNMTQAIITIGSGKFTGRGMGMGTQSGLFFLPENHTDFSFSSLVEQFGFLGGAVVIVLYFVLIVALIRRTVSFYYQRDGYGKFKFLFTLGFLSSIIFQIFINIGMNLGLLPIAGITLPLISYGGSSLLSYMIGLSLLPDK